MEHPGSDHVNEHGKTMESSVKWHWHRLVMNNHLSPRSISLYMIVIMICIRLGSLVVDKC